MITRTPDYTRCDPEIAKALKEGKHIQCFCSRQPKANDLYKCWVVGYRAGCSLCYITEDEENFRYAYPIRTKTVVKKASEIVKWLEENEYTVDEWGSWRHLTKKGFDPLMFHYCGKEPSTDYNWSSNWLEEVEY